MGARLHREMDVMEISATLSSFACQLDISGKNCKKSGSSLIAQCGRCASYVAVRSCCTCAGRAQCKKLNNNFLDMEHRVVCLILDSFACQLDISGKKSASSLIAQCVNHAEAHDSLFDFICKSTQHAKRNAKPMGQKDFSAWILILFEC